MNTEMKDVSSLWSSKKILFYALLLLCASVTIAFVVRRNTTNQSITLIITESQWAGHEEPPPDEEPPLPLITTQELSQGDTVTFWRNLGPMRVVEIRDDTVVVRFRANGIAPNVNGRIPVVRERSWTAEIKYGEVYLISTDWASEGITWSLVFEKN